jgi:hypothetical protein
MLAVGCGQQEAQKGPSVMIAPEPDAGEDAVNPATNGSRDGAAADSDCEITPDYLRHRKACTADADCEVVPFTPQCCKSTQLVGVAHAAAEEVRACAAENASDCRCREEEPTRAEDGRASSLDDMSDVSAQCVAGECRTTVTTRSCGSDTCQPDEICVAYENTHATTPAPGGNALYTLECVPNPCTRSLDCSCAQTVCEREDAARACQLQHVTESDIDCTLHRI